MYIIYIYTHTYIIYIYPNLQKTVKTIVFVEKTVSPICLTVFRETSDLVAKHIAGTHFPPSWHVSALSTAWYPIIC